MSIEKIKLQSKSLSKKAKREIISLLPDVESFKKLNVPEMGPVLYIYNDLKESIAHAYKDQGELCLFVK